VTRLGIDLRSAAAILALAVLAACGSKPKAQEQEQETSGGSAQPGRDDPARDPSDEFLMKPTYAIEKVGIPDEPGWNRAVDSATRAWAESLNKIATSARVRPVRSPDGAIAPYLLEVEAWKDGEQVFRLTALISRGLMINGGGKARLEAHLGLIGFPKTRLSAGHLIEMLYLTAALDRSWLPAPGAVWDPPAPQPSLVYNDDGAVLTLYRETERMELRFDASGRFTTTP
jgi:hypothetical protein